MGMKTEINSVEYQLTRYPKTEDKSLRAWSNAELLVLDYIVDKKTENIHLFNDRFGVWNCALNDKKLITVWTYASQKKAIEQNLKLNNFSDKVNYKTPLEDLNKVELALLKIPKSLELFELFLQQIHKAANDKTEVVCGFMTKHFSASYLKIAEKYFNVVQQSKAWKKARLLVLEQPNKKVEYNELINKINWKNNLIKQYYGVFSSGRVDIGTQFFLEHLNVKEDDLNILDVASGNGIIALEASNLNPNSNITLIDDFNLAIASSQLNLKDKKANFICVDNLNHIEKNSFDLVLSNPPFHFEYENNIEVALNLFEGVKNCLQPNGRFLLVANKHLNYKTHLDKLFREVVVVSSNKKFEVIQCS